jgi:hypothetical protein
MALDPQARYASAGTLAADIERWLADEPVRACAEPWPQRLARWARRHKPLVSGLLALLITAVIALSASTWIISEQKNEVENALRNEQTARREHFGTLESKNRLTRRLAEDMGTHADTLAVIQGLSGEQHYHLARMYALAAAFSGGDRAQEYAKQAVMQLRRSADTGFFKVPTHAADLRTEPDFVSVRQRSDFQQLVEEVESRRKVDAP